MNRWIADTHIHCWMCDDCWAQFRAADGMLSGFSRDARGFLGEAGYDSRDYPKVAIELEQAIGEGAMEAAFDVMRQHGLYPHTDLRAPANQPPADSSKEG